MLYVYILQSIEFKRLYIGHSAIVDNRILRHNQGRSKATKPYIPYRTIAVIPRESRSDAIALEKHLKRLKNQQSLKRYLNRHFREYIREEII
jgi:putative endonuclease